MVMVIIIPALVLFALIAVFLLGFNGETRRTSSSLQYPSIHPEVYFVRFNPSPPSHNAGAPYGTDDVSIYPETANYADLRSQLFSALGGGARLATLSELEKSQLAGADWCEGGLTSNDGGLPGSTVHIVTSASGGEVLLSVYPTNGSTETDTCAPSGNAVYINKLPATGLNVYGRKPAPTSALIQALVSPFRSEKTTDGYKWSRYG